jgi:hypothetical protein
MFPRERGSVNKGRIWRTYITFTAVVEGIQERSDKVNSKSFNNKLSKKRNVLSLSTTFIFSKLNTCKYLYEHDKIQQLRHKLNKFHRHVTNINGIMCP